MATFKQVLIKALEQDGSRLASINQNLMEVSRATKRKPNNIKIAVSDETVNNYLSARPKEVGFMIFIDGDELNKIAKELDSE